jgi:hypothetical protein
MKRITLLACIAMAAIACNQLSSATSTNKMHKPIPDIISDNVKGKVQQIVTETYLIDSVTGKMGKLESKGTEIYDDNGYATSFINYTANDSATTVTKLERDANGYTTGVNSTKNDKPLSSMKIEVDSMGKYTLATSFDSLGKVDVYYDEITTNDFGQVTGAKGHHADSSLKMSFTNDFDSVYYSGGESKDSVGKITYTSKVQLNEKKDPAQIDETNVVKDSTTKTTTVYAYDKWDAQGNWTQQTTTQNGKPKKIIVRTITYKE